MIRDCRRVFESFVNFKLPNLALQFRQEVDFKVYFHLTAFVRCLGQPLYAV